MGITGDLSVEGNTTLGNEVSDTLVVNAATTLSNTLTTSEDINLLSGSTLSVND